MSYTKIKTVNLLTKMSAGKKRSARLAFWQSESKALRKKHRSVLTGASLLTVSLTLLHILLSIESVRLLHFINAPYGVIAAFITLSVIFGTAMLSLLNLGGRRLALLLYRAKDSECDNINVGELFFPFGRKKDRKKCSKLMMRTLKKLVAFAVITVLSVLCFIFTGLKAGIISAALILLLSVIFSPQGRAIEWIFTLGLSGGSMPPEKLSAYAMLSRTRDGKKLASAKRKLRLISLITFFTGYPIFALMRLWTLDAVFAECVSSELIAEK